MAQKKAKSKKYSINISKRIALLSLIALLLGWFTTYLVNLKQIKLFTSAPSDTGVFLNTINNLLDGSFFFTTLGASGIPVSSNLLDVHSFFILLFIAPLHAIFDSPKFLYFLHNSFIYLSSIPLYLIALTIFKSKNKAFIIAVLFITTPILYFNALGEFHPENFGLVFFLFSYWFFVREKYIYLIIFSLLALSCLEFIATYYVSLGAMHFIFSRKKVKKKYYLTLMGIGFFWIVFYYGLMKNLLVLENSYNFFPFYFSHWNIPDNNFTSFNLGNLANLMIFFLKNPLLLFESIFNFSKWSYLFSLIGLSLFFLLINYKFIIVVLPTLIYFVMNDRVFFHDIHSYYFNFLFIFSLIAFCLTINKFFIRKKIPVKFFYGLVALTMGVNFYFLFMKLPPTFSYNFLTQSPIDERLQLAQEAMGLIPKEAGVMSQHRYTYYLSNRKDYFLNNISYNGGDYDAALKNTYKEKYYDRIDYIFIDLVSSQPCHTNAFYCFQSQKEDIEKRQAAVISLIDSKKWRLVFGNQGIILLQRVR